MTYHYKPGTVRWRVAPKGDWREHENLSPSSACSSTRSGTRRLTQPASKEQTMKTSNKNARGFVQRREPFRVNNTYAEIIGGRYVVYSYGAHWPLFVHEGGQWYFNSSKYGATTSKHHSQLHPLCDGTALPVEKMLELAQHADQALGGVTKSSPR